MTLDLTPQQWIAWYSDDVEEREGFRAEVRARLVAQLRTQTTHVHADFAVVSDRGRPLERVFADGRVEARPGSEKPRRER